MINLVDTNDTLQIVLAGAVTTNQAVIYASWSDRVSTPVTDYLPGELDTLSNGATAVDIVTSPSAGNIRQVKHVNIYNNDTAPMTVTVRFNNNATLRTILTVVLQVGERIQYNDFDGWHVFTALGAVKVTAVATTVEPGYIDGMQLIWNSTTSYTVLSGSCYIPSVGTNVNFPSDTVKAGLVLSANTWYHLYAFLNSGIPDIEHVTTAPSTFYNGRARTKTGDTTRRYVGSFRTGAGGVITQFKTDTLGSQRYLTSNALQRILSAGTATVRTNISGSNFIPVTATHAIVVAANTDTTTFWNLGTPEATSAPFLGIAPNTPGAIITFPCSDTQQFDYNFTAAPTGAAFLDVVGFHVGR